MNSRNKLVIYTLICFILATIIIILYKNKYVKYDSFELPKTTKQSIPTSFERTQLYGSLFLDGLDTVIQNLTDPPIIYDTKQMELTRYSDTLL